MINLSDVVAKEQFRIGALTIEVLHTPGHTLESTCYLLKDENGKDHCVFTGDTLFVGDVGRPDLAQGGDLTMSELAGMLYESLQKKIMPLADDVIVYPAHGPGSSCGKNLGPETHSTIAEQKANNYALQQQSKEEFIKAVTKGLEAPPKYFPVNARINKEGYGLMDALLKKGLTALSVEQFKELSKEPKTLILDTRHADTFTLGFIPGSISIGLEGRFAEWAGALLPFDENILLVCEDGKEEETIVRLARVGFDKVLGYLEGGFAAWQEAGKEVDQVTRITADEFAAQFIVGESMVIDVRKESEYEAEHVEDAYSKPLAYINDWTKDIQPDQHFFLHCAGGYRSMIAASILQARGYRNFTEVDGGFGAISKTEVPRTDFVCQSKVLKTN